MEKWIWISINSRTTNDIYDKMIDDIDLMTFDQTITGTTTVVAMVLL